MEYHGRVQSSNSLLANVDELSALTNVSGNLRLVRLRAKVSVQVLGRAASSWVVCVSALERCAYERGRTVGIDHCGRLSPAGRQSVTMSVGVGMGLGWIGHELMGGEAGIERCAYECRRIVGTDDCGRPSLSGMLSGWCLAALSGLGGVAVEELMGLRSSGTTH